MLAALPSFSSLFVLSLIIYSSVLAGFMILKVYIDSQVFTKLHQDCGLSLDFYKLIVSALYWCSNCP